jgi:hypothetical protein
MRAATLRIEMTISLGVWKEQATARATAEADPYGMTNKRTSNGKNRGTFAGSVLS